MYKMEIFHDASVVRTTGARENGHKKFFKKICENSSNTFNLKISLYMYSTMIEYYIEYNMKVNKHIYR